MRTMPRTGRRYLPASSVPVAKVRPPACPARQRFQQPRFEHGGEQINRNIRLATSPAGANMTATDRCNDCMGRQKWDGPGWKPASVGPRCCRRLTIANCASPFSAGDNHIMLQKDTDRPSDLGNLTGGTGRWHSGCMHRCQCVTSGLAHAMSASDRMHLQ
eukprot:365171-Chlamydomonas_euryale.AAC.15